MRKTIAIFVLLINFLTLPAFAKFNYEQRVNEVIAHVLNANPFQIQPQQTLAADLGADELDRVEIFMALESAFYIAIPKADYNQLTSVQQIVAYIKQKAPDRSAF